MGDTKKAKGSAGRKFLDRCRSGLVQFLDSVYSKDDRLVIFGSSNGRQFYGCPKVIYEYMVKNCTKDFDCYYYLEDGPADDPRCLRKGGFFNWATIKKVIRARTVIGSHGMWDFGPWGFSSKKIFIHTGHGFPMKAVALSSKSSTKKIISDWRLMGKRVTVELASSELMADLLSIGHGIPRERYLVVGQAKNDKLVDNVLDPEPPYMMKLPPHQKVILYVPTFREWESARLFPFDDFDLPKLTEFLERNKTVILVRCHINEMEGAKSYIGGRVVDFSYDYFPDVQNDEVLPHVDAVMTDYSSIYLDFLLLDRPVLFLPYDLEHYKEARGFMVDDYHKFTPGPKPGTFKEFLGALQDLVDGKDEYRAERKRVNALVSSAQTANTPKNVVEYLRKKLGKN